MERRPSRAPAAVRSRWPSGHPGQADESPTVVKRDSGVLAPGNLVDVVPKITVEVKHECDHEPRRILHQGEVCRIGTHSSNDVVLRDPAVSRFHCKLTYDANLREQGVIKIGDSELHVRASEGTEVSLPNVQSFGALLGASVAMRKLFAFLEKVAASEINVLIEGESGTGKELVAAEIVQRGPRADGPFVIVDCGAVSPNLVESELFGHVRGAFTGADRDRVGAFETANTGTVFLDEIGELPLELQPKFLRALEAREVRRVGETRARKVDVRVIAATNRDLEREVNKGRFREDLYFRLAVMSVRLPSLRERLDDLPLLIRGFLGSLGVPEQIRLFPPQILAELSTYDWPGNVRELRNYVERTVVLEEPLMALRRQQPAGAGSDPQMPFKIAKDAVVDAFERNYVTALLDGAAGNVSRAARSGGMDRMYLHRLIQKHGLRAGVKASK
jgi:transcriptional regulator with GAF, ATPase, and Fis domain